MLELLVTRLEGASTGELFLGFKDHGGIYIPWKHLFSSKIIGSGNLPKDEDSANRQIKKIQDEIANIPELINSATRNKNNYWWTFQLYCNPNLKDKLPSIFLKNNYTKQARWRLAPEGHFIKADDTLIYALKSQKAIASMLSILETKVSQSLENKSAGTLTRTLNKLDKLFSSRELNNNDETKLDEYLNKLLDEAKSITPIKKLDNSIFAHRNEISVAIEKANKILEGKFTFFYTKENNSNRYDLKLVETAPKYMENLCKNSRAPNIDELLKMKWLFFDTETPFYKTNREITWTGVATVQDENGKQKVDKFIFTPNKLDSKKINGYKIISDVPNDAFVEFVKTFSPDIISTYKTSHDLIEYRESESGFAVGDENSDPKYKSSMPTFEKIGLKGMFVLDLLQWQKIARKFEINAKLELAAGIQKIISYDEMEQLERDKEYATVAKYLTGDVDALISNLFETDEFKKSLESILWLSDNFKIGFEKIFNSPNSSLDFMERKFFEQYGINRDDLPDGRDYLERKADSKHGHDYFIEQMISDGLKFIPKKGLSKDVYKVFIPVGDIFRDAMETKFKFLKEFYEYKDTTRSDRRNLFFLEQHNMTLCNWLIEDFGFLEKKVSALEKTLKKICTNTAPDGLSLVEFEEAYRTFNNILLLEKWNKQKTKNGNNNQPYSINDLENKFNKFKEKYSLSSTQLGELFSIRNNIAPLERQFRGKYSLMPKRVFMDPYNKGLYNVDALDEIVHRKFDEIKSFTTNNNIKLIARDGLYLYVTGCKEILNDIKSPLIVVDEIPALFNADKTYYEKQGYYLHLSVKDNPDFHLCMFEMNAYSKMLDSLLSDDVDTAKNIYNIFYEQIKNKQIENESLLFLNKSKQYNFAYVDKEQYGSETFFFTTPTSPGVIHAEKINHDEKLDLDYFLDTYRKRAIKVYITNNIPVNLNYAAYLKKFEEKGNILLNAGIKKQNKNENKNIDNNQETSQLCIF